MDNSFLSLFFAQEIPRCNLIMITGTRLRHIMPYEHGDNFLCIGSFHLGEDIPNLCRIKRMLRNRIRTLNPTQTPSFMFNTLQMKRLENKIGDFFEHKTEKLEILSSLLFECLFGNILKPPFDYLVLRCIVDIF